MDIKRDALDISTELYSLKTKLNKTVYCVICIFCLIYTEELKIYQIHRCKIQWYHYTAVNSKIRFVKAPYIDYRMGNPGPRIASYLRYWC